MSIYATGVESSRMWNGAICKTLSVNENFFQQRLNELTEAKENMKEMLNIMLPAR